MEHNLGSTIVTVTIPTIAFRNVASMRAGYGTPQADRRIALAVMKLLMCRSRWLKRLRGAPRHRALPVRDGGRQSYETIDFRLIRRARQSFQATGL